MHCPICERDFDPASPAAAKPFCSDRCRLIDLGRWLGEGYSLSAERGVEADEQPDEPAESAP
jgi:uncharacterized protein